MDRRAGEGAIEMDLRFDFEDDGENGPIHLISDFDGRELSRRLCQRRLAVARDRIQKFQKFLENLAAATLPEVHDHCLLVVSPALAPLLAGWCRAHHLACQPEPQPQPQPQPQIQPPIFLGPCAAPPVFVATFEDDEDERRRAHMHLLTFRVTLIDPSDWNSSPFL